MRPTTKRNQQVAARYLEKALIKWVCDQSNRGVALNGKRVVLHAKELPDVADANTYGNKKLEHIFSSGLIRRFKKRHNTRFRGVHGEAKSPDEDAISFEMPRITNLLKNYVDEDIWNTD